MRLILSFFRFRKQENVFKKSFLLGLKSQDFNYLWFLDKTKSLILYEIK